MLLRSWEVNGSVIDAFKFWLSTAYEFEGTQLRTTQLASTERTILSILVVRLSTFFQISPWIIWGLFKLLFLTVVYFSIQLFLRNISINNKNRNVEFLDKNKIRIIQVLSVLFIAAGLELESIGYTNGWIYYPNLSYLPFAWYLLISVLLIAVNRLYQRNAIWLWVFTPLFVLIAWAVNLSYELMALSIPFSLLVLFFADATIGEGFLQRFKSKIYIALIFGGSYSTIFLWTRYQISQMACKSDGSCYDGTVVEFDLGTVLRNLYSGFPGTGLQWITLNIDNVELSKFLVISALFTGLVLSISSYFLIVSNNLSQNLSIKWVIVISTLMIFISISVTTITGITERAVDRLAEPISPYRSGPILIFSLSILFAVITVFAISKMRENKLKQFFLVSVISIVTIATITNWTYNMNLLNQQLRKHSVAVVERIYEEISIGELGKNSNDRRCELLTFLNQTSKNSRGEKVTLGAQLIFKQQHGVAFCTRYKIPDLDIKNIDQI